MKKSLQSRKRLLCLVAPALIGALYLVLCIINLNQSIWFDEAYGSYITRFDFGQMLSFTAADVHPPLYYILLKTWAHFFGHTVYAMRMMSAVFGAIAIVFAFLWLKYKYGSGVATLGSLMLAIAPVFVRYGQEMRMYTLVVAIVFAATYVLELAINNRKKIWWVLYAVLLAAGMWTHYFVAFAWVAHLIYLIHVYGKKIFQKRIILTYVGAVALYLPWLPSLISQTGDVQGNGFWIKDITINGIASYFTETLLYNNADGISGWLLVLFFATLITIIALAVRYRKKLTMLFCLAIAPVVGLVLLSLPPLAPMFISRYLVYAMLAISLIEAVTLALFARDAFAKKSTQKLAFYRRPAVSVAIVAALFIGTSVCGLASVYHFGNYNFITVTKSTSKELFDSIVELDAGENLSIISNDPWLYYDLATYTSYHHDVNFIDEQTEYPYGSLKPLKESYFGKINDLDAFLADREAVWYVGSAPEEGQLEFPREGWYATTEATMQFDERGYTYQILKLERE